MNYFDDLRQLLQTEQTTDRESYKAMSQQASVAERRLNGTTWYPVAIRGSEPGKDDYLTIELERTTHHDIVHQLRSGMPAALFSNHDTQHRLEGTINWVGGNRLNLALREDELPEWTTKGKLGVDLLFDENSYEEMFGALKKADELLYTKEGRLVKVLTGNKQPEFSTQESGTENTLLNDMQQAAVNLIIAATDVAVVHGPPGTGKTTTLVAAIKEMAANNEGQLLVTAASNAAVDLLSQKLANEGLKVVRIGNPARVSEAMLSLTLDEQTARHPQIKEAKKLRKQAQAYRDMAHKYKRNFGAAERTQRKALFDEAHKVMKDVERMEDYVNKSILDEARVITATLVGANHFVARNRTYYAIVIDEAGQALEPACWIPVLKGKKLVMAGDHCQLPPTIKSEKAARAGLDNTLMAKCAALWPQAVVMLREQYRMHREIMYFPSAMFYQGQLLAHPSVADHRINAEEKPLVFIDTAGCGFEEKTEGTSVCNPEEAGLVLKHLTLLLQNFHTNNCPTVGVVAPYRQQVSLLQELVANSGGLAPFAPNITVNTIDSFQGQERDVIYISLTRSNTDGIIGFLNDTRRMNVAMTRARKKLVVFGDSATISSAPFYGSFIGWAEQTGGWQSAWELMGD
ncbi:MAG: AAA domain-containing protein [Edaphocola sp.]